MKRLIVQAVTSTLLLRLVAIVCALGSWLLGWQAFDCARRDDLELGVVLLVCAGLATGVTCVCVGFSQLGLDYWRERALDRGRLLADRNRP